MKTIALYSLVAACLVAGLSCEPEDEAATQPESPPAAQTVEATKPLYAFALPDIDGNLVNLGEYRGKTLLLVNVASKCGYTKQYAGLQELYRRYEGRGLVILGFPANNFGAQEPGTNEQIKEFCSVNYGVTFPMFAKISVKGDDMHPLYRFLTDSRTNPQFAGDIRWNFTKFLVSRDGDIAGRYESAVEPLDERLISDVEDALGSTGGTE